MASPAVAADGVVRLIDGPVGAYVHVPFCTRICPFCPYNKVVPRGDQPAAYFRALRAEVAAYVDAGAGGSGGFTSLYVGGGTPTLFPAGLARIVAGIPVIGERAIEVLPTHGTTQRLDQLRDVGFTAVSVGVQSFHDGVLRRLRRPHDAATARRAVASAIGRFDLVDVDLIVDVEMDDSLAGAFLSDLEDCLAMGVDQVSTYPLMRFGFTPFGAGGSDRHREHEVLAEATRVAARYGFQRRSVWTFNRPTSASYTSITRRRFLGMGAGSSSFTGRDFLVNHFGVSTYIDAVESGRLPIARRLHLGTAGGLAYDAFWQAYAGGVDPRGLHQAYGPSAAAVHAGLIGLAAAGLVRRNGGGWELTARGFDAYHDLERWVTYQLIEPLWAEMIAEHAHDEQRWASPASARRSRLWQVASQMMRREPPTTVSRRAGEARLSTAGRSRP